MEKKEQIILAAMELLIQNGVQATPMSAVATAAKTGMGTIYNYFPTKEDLINDIYLYIKQAEGKHVTTQFNDEPVRKQFEHFYRTMITYMVANPSHFLFMEQFSSSPIIRDDIKEAGLNGFSNYHDVLRLGQKQGLIKNISLEELMLFIHGGFRAFIRWVLGNNKQPSEQLINDQLRMAWDCIKE